MKTQIYAIIPIHTYKVNIDVSINTKLYYTYNSLFYNKNSFNNIITKNKYTKYCQEIINNIYENINTINYSDIVQTHHNINLFRYYLANYIKNNYVNSKKTLLYSNIFEYINELKFSIKNFDTYMFENEEMPEENYNLLFEKFSKDNNLSFSSINDKEKSNKKYDTVVLKFNEFLNDKYNSVFILSKLPYLLIIIMKSILKLNNNGNLLINTRIMYVNQAIEWIMTFLSNIFETINIIENKNNIHTSNFDSSILLECINFKNNSTHINKIINAILDDNSILKYNYSVCEMLDYYAGLTKQNSKSFDNNFNLYPMNIIDGVNDKKKFKELYVIDKINIELEKTPKAEFLIYKLREQFSNFITNINYNINQFMSVKNDKIIIKQELINKITYNRIINIVNFSEENNLPYNKAYLVYINRYNENIVNNLFSYNNSINFKFLKYQDTSSNKFQKDTLNKLMKYDDYHYNKYDKSINLLNLSNQVSYSLLEDIGTSKIPNIILRASENFSNIISEYIMNNYKLKNQITNTFCKLWEVYNSIDDLFPLKKNPKIFFINESSGQSVYASDLYYYNNYKKKYPVGKYDIDWYINELYEDNPINVSKYSKNMSKNKDNYKEVYIIGKYTNTKKKILYGVDNTGDITNINNHNWYGSFFGKNKLDFIFADTFIENDNPVIYQKFELATVCMIFNLLSVGSNCVVRNLLPYRNKILLNQSYGFFTNYIYLYYLMFDEVRLVKLLISSSNSSEFYIIGKGYKGIDDNTYQTLLALLENFSGNLCLFKKSDIPNEFVNQLLDFVNRIININVDYREIYNLLLTCMINKNEVINEKTQCNQYLDNKYITELHLEKCKEWYKNNRIK
jgi:hypothetical protein